MNTETISQYKKQLEEEKSKLTEELKSVKRINPDNPNDWEPTPEEDPISHPADPNVEADQVEEYEERTAILKQLEIRWNEIKDALERIEHNTYGTCDVCEQPIEEERLDANPAARTCIKHMNNNH